MEFPPSKSSVVFCRAAKELNITYLRVQQNCNNNLTNDKNDAAKIRKQVDEVAV